MWRSRRALSDAVAAAAAATKPRMPYRDAAGRMGRAVCAAQAGLHHHHHRQDSFGQDGTPPRRNRSDRRGFAASAAAANNNAGRAAEATSCWSCVATTSRSDYFFCGACGVLLPAAAEKDHEQIPDFFFHILDITPRFNVAPEELEAGRDQHSLLPECVRMVHTPVHARVILLPCLTRLPLNVCSDEARSAPVLCTHSHLTPWPDAAPRLFARSAPVRALPHSPPCPDAASPNS